MGASGYATQRGLDGLRARMAAMVQQQTQQVSNVRQSIPRTTRIVMGQIGVAIAVGTPVDIPITWSTPMPKDTYAVDVTPATGLIGKATTAVKPGSMTASGVTITVSASVAVLVGAQFIAAAFC